MENGKIKITFPEIENVTIKFDNQKIEIRPYLTLGEQIELINKYVQNYIFGNGIIELSVYDYIGAELQLMLAIVDKLTNVEVADSEGNLLINESDLLVSGLWSDIVSKLQNYSGFRKLLDRVIEDVKYQTTLQQSVGNVLDNVSKKIVEFIGKISQTELTPEFVNKIKEASKEITENIGNNPIAKAAYQESAGIGEVKKLDEVAVVAEKVEKNNGSRRGRKPKAK